ncbi:MAG: hypothetical protein WBD20_04865 [Pirellulaceae bacterium]
MIHYQVHLGIAAAHLQSGRSAKPMLWRLRSLAYVLLAVSVTSTFMIGSTAALATENYRVVPMNKAFDDPANFRRMESAAKRYAYAESIEKFADEGYARAYYLYYLPARITQQESMGEISDLMSDVRKRVTRSNRVGAPGAQNIMRWLYSGLRPIAEGDYRPVARINAILMISRLDVVPADPSAKTSPVPSAVIPKVLLPLYQNEMNSDGVRAAALKGLRRYVNLAAESLEKQHSDTLVAEMKTLLEQKSPAGRDPVAHAYLQRFAVDILASLQAPTATEFGDQLVSLSTNDDTHQLLAVHAASRLASVPCKLQENRTAKLILARWTSLTAEAIDQEVDRLERMTQPKPASRQPLSPDHLVQLNQNANKPRQGAPMARNAMQGDPGDQYDGMDSMEPDAMDEGNFGPGMGTMLGNRQLAQPTEVIMSRRKLNFVIQQLHTGALGNRKSDHVDPDRGLMAAVASDDRQIIQGWLQQLQTVVDQVNSPTLRTRELYIAKLKELSAGLKTLSKSMSLAPPAAPAPPLAIHSCRPNHASA